MLELADAVIIGGGVTGMALARELSHRMSRVLLVEANRCGAAATAGGFAWVNASSKWDDPGYHRLNADGCRVHHEMATVWDAFRTGWHGGGSLAWARRSHATEMGSLVSRFEALQALEYPVFWLSRGEMEVLEPNVQFAEDAIGMFAASEGWSDTRMLMRLMAEDARARNAEIAEYTQATGFSLDHRGAISSVETTAGRVSTRIVVICAGAQSARIAGLIPGYRAPHFLTRRPGLLVEVGPVHETARLHRVCYPATVGAFHARPTPDGGLLSGADDTDLLASGAAQAAARSSLDRALANGTERLSARARSILPALGPDVPAAARICERPMPA